MFRLKFVVLIYLFVSFYQISYKQIELFVLSINKLKLNLTDFLKWFLNYLNFVSFQIHFVCNLILIRDQLMKSTLVNVTNSDQQWIINIAPDLRCDVTTNRASLGLKGFLGLFLVSRKKIESNKSYFKSFYL